MSQSSVPPHFLPCFETQNHMYDQASDTKWHCKRLKAIKESLVINQININTWKGVQSQPKDGDLVYNNHSDSGNGIICITDCTAVKPGNHCISSVVHQKKSAKKCQLKIERRSDGSA